MGSLKSTGAREGPTLKKMLSTAPSGTPSDASAAAWAGADTDGMTSTSAGTTGSVAKPQQAGPLAGPPAQQAERPEGSISAPCGTFWALQSRCKVVMDWARRLNGPCGKQAGREEGAPLPPSGWNSLSGVLGVIWWAKVESIATWIANNESGGTPDHHNGGTERPGGGRHSETSHGLMQL